MTSIPLDEQLPTILAVDDHQKNLYTLNKILAHLDANIVFAGSGNEALAALLNHDVALVLLDIQMPDMDGFEVASIMREDEKAKHIPIIFLTAIQKESKHISQGYNLGAVDYLFKPVDPDILLHKVQIFLGLYNYRQQSLIQLLHETRAELGVRQKELEKLAHQDKLTGLCNRATLESLTSQEISRAKRHDYLLALLFIDLDHFKKVNDSLGHLIGDQLLQQVSQRLCDSLRHEDIVARLGGDEFAILLTDFNEPSIAGRVAQKVIAALSPVFEVEQHQLHVTASIGIATYPIAGKTLESLLRCADIAMYRAKELDRNNHQFFTQDLNVKYMKRATLENALHQAIDENQLYLAYQPKYYLDSRTLSGAEALLRWQHPILGNIPPDEFISIAEECGLIIPIGQWVINEVCRQINAWQDKFDFSPAVAINLSPLQLSDKTFIDSLSLILNSSSLEAQSIEFELTETALMEAGSYLVEILQQLHQLNIKISIDDFGTGYSSLARLKTLPINALKIDRSFINDLTTDPNDRAIVTSIISLAHNLGIDVIAEGIETQEQENFLCSQQCAEGQGYFYSRPLSAEILEEKFLASKS